MAALDRVGISDQAGQRAGTLSGGQQQRAAIARALMQRARVILADEPDRLTGPGILASRDGNLVRHQPTRRRAGRGVVASGGFRATLLPSESWRSMRDGLSSTARLPAWTSDLLTDIYGAEAEDAGIAADRGTEFVPPSNPPGRRRRALMATLPSRRTDMLSKLATLVAAGGLLAGAATAALAVDTNDLETIRFRESSPPTVPQTCATQWVDFIAAMEDQTGYTVEPVLRA